MPKKPEWEVNKDPSVQIDWFDGTDYDFLSNFHPSEVQIRVTATGRESDKYLLCPTVEHAFQACKTTDVHRRRAIAGVKNPGVAKAMGNDRKATRLRVGWDQLKFDLMYRLLKQKFAIPELRERLLATGEARLIEGNSWNDRVWGQCPLGTGRNMLGITLMRVREEIRSGSR